MFFYILFTAEYKSFMAFVFCGEESQRNLIKKECIMSKGKAVSRGQALQVSARVATQVNWDELDGNNLQDEIINLTPEEFGSRFTTFLKNGAKASITKSNAVPIDRSKPFNPIEFFGKDWIIVEQDERSLALTQVDLTNVYLETCLKKGETCIKGEEKLRRFKRMDCIRLDAKIFQTLWGNKHLIPETWKEKINNKIRFIFFDGTVLCCPDGYRCVLSLYWDDDKWRSYYHGLDDGWLISDQSAVLASS